jgi:hypothetical protein
MAPIALLLLALAAILLLIIGSRSPAISRWSPALGNRPLNSENSPVQFSMPSGSYNQAIDVELSSPNPAAAIYFTTNGTLPTPETATLYTGPIHIPAGQPRAAALRARTRLPDGEFGPEANATYFMNVDANIPLISLTVDPHDLWDDETGIFANPHSKGRKWEREADIFYYDPQQRTGLESPVGLRVHGAGSRDYAKKSLRLYFRNEYGRPFLEYPVFPDADEERFKHLVLHDGGQDFPAVSLNGTLIRNHLVGNLVRQAGGYATYSRPSLLFLNGELWGIYNIRERIDDLYLSEKFQIEDADLLSGFEHSLQASYGDSAHWEHLIDFVAAHDLTDDANYNYVQTQVNLDNFIDYALFQIITANTDWPHNNQLKFRDRANGRWHWMYWDSDRAFGLMRDSYIEKDMFEHILDNEDPLQQQSSLLLRKLLQNPQFKNHFLSRLADLLNTVFTPGNVLAEIDQLVAVLEQDIAYEKRRWPGAGNWEDSVDYMREFARQRPDIVRGQTVAAFDLPGLASLTINRPDIAHGAILINDGSPLRNQDLPWQGQYFQGVNIQLAAVPDPGYRFVDWGSPDLPQTADLSLSLSGDLALQPRFERDNSDSQEAGVVRGSVIFTGYGRDGEDAPVQGLQGDWVEIQVRSLSGVDLRGWRVSDNDSLTSTDEGSLIFGDHPALENVPVGTTVLLVAEKTPANDLLFLEDDLSALNGRLILYAGNGILDTHSDPWFKIGKEDNLVLLAPGETADLADDLAIDSLLIGPGGTAVFREEAAGAAGFGQ